MSSYISHFKAWIVAAAILVAIEGAIYAVAPTNPMDRTNFLLFSFGRSEPAQRLFVFHKLRAFEHSNPTVVQSGDSSGFYGIDPRVVMKHLPSDVSYLNMSCCANLGYRGYYNVFKFLAERNKSVRYMVLHITPYTMPRPETWDSDGISLWGPGVEVFGGAVHDEFMGPRQVTHLPSMAYRRQVTNSVFYFGPIINYVRQLMHHQGPQAVSSADGSQVGGGPSPDTPLSTNENYLAFLKIYRESRGWMPENDQRSGVYASECDIPTPEFYDLKTMSYKTYLEEVFDSFASLAKQYNSTLVIVFQPVACVLGTGAANARARAIVEQFKRSHRDVEIPFPLIETWPVDMFSVPAHVRHEYTDRIGDRLGNAMAEIIARRGLEIPAH